MFIGSHLPMKPDPVESHRDKLVHFGAFALLTFLMAIYRGQLGRMTRTSYAVIFTIAACYGVFDELTQSLVPGRSADLLDWVTDLAGALAGLGAYALYQRYIRGPSPGNDLSIVSDVD